MYTSSILLHFSPPLSLSFYFKSDDNLQTTVFTIHQLIAFKKWCQLKLVIKGLSFTLSPISILHLFQSALFTPPLSNPPHLSWIYIRLHLECILPTLGFISFSFPPPFFTVKFMMNRMVRYRQTNYTTTITITTK